MTLHYKFHSVIVWLYKVLQYLTSKKNNVKMVIAEKKVITRLVSDIIFSDCFDTQAKHDKMAGILVENRYICPNTFNWVDRKKGKKGVIVALLKTLEAQGYFKKELIFNDNLIMDLCSNSFGVKLSSSTVRHVKFSDMEFKFLSVTT